jgi:hypothetical protein
VRRFSGEVVLELVVGEVPASGDGDEVADEVQQMMAISNPWSLTTRVFRGNGDARLEMMAASVIVGELEILREKAGQGCYLTRPREGRRLGGSRGKGEAGPHRNQRRLAASPASSGDEFQQPGGFFCREKREGRERRAGAL